jgi:hypothetical protein
LAWKRGLTRLRSPSVNEMDIVNTVFSLVLFIHVARPHALYPGPGQ